MGLFNFFFKKKEKQPDITVQVTHYDYSSENAKQIELSRQENARLAAENEKQIKAIDFSKMIAGNSDENLSNIEIDFLGYLDNKKLSDLKIARYWFETGVDYQFELEKFFRCGLLDFESIQESLIAQKAADLKLFLSEKGLPAQGKKETLIATILDSDTPENLVAAFPPGRIKLTTKGTSIVLKKRKRDLDQKFRTASVDSHKHLQAGELHAYRDDLMAIAEVYMEEKTFRSALESLMMIFVLDASGAPTAEMIRRNQERIKEGWIKKGTLLEYHPLIIPYPMRLIDKAINELNLSIEEVEQVFRETITQEQIPLSFCTVDEFTKLFLSAVSGDGKADDLVKKYKQRFIAKYAK